ncbi:hypothetical protein OH76DRAFT_335865 [Lentinus brumalis]|uniref:Uncharacterized protein n=1 Tax=Lentinus brumalis TaxID=2498619 RepID=A0A371CJM5_9APHY|nr:hypothetical protein OH76DRAFT_335865 [Polyporus brumalis]
MNHALVSWRAEPDFRGTFTIFTSCMSTLSICIWSALHVDIQKGRSKPIQYLAKGGWLIVGLLCPELLLFNAFHQLKQAIRLTRDGQRMLYLDGGATQPRSRIMQVLEDWLVGGKPSATSAPLLDAESIKRTEVGFENIVRKHPWTLAHGFYAAMGGFVLKDPYVDRSDDHYLPSWQLNGVITPDGVRFLMQHAPSLIPDLALDDILDRSKADGLAKTLLVWQVLWFLLTCINRLVQGLPLCLLEISTIAHALCSLLTYALWWYKPKDVSHPTAILAPDARLIGAWMSMASMADQYLIGGILKVDIPCEMTFVEVVETDNGIGGARISFQRPEERASALPASCQQKPPRRTPRVVFREAVHSRRARLIFGAATLPWYVQGSSETPEEMRATTLRCALASEAHNKYGLARPAPETPIRLVVPVASLQAFTDTHEHEFAGILRTSLTAAVPPQMGVGAIFTSSLARAQLPQPQSSPQGQALWRLCMGCRISLDSRCRSRVQPKGPSGAWRQCLSPP